MALNVQEQRKGTGFRVLGAADLDLLERLFENLTNAPFFVKSANLEYVAANPAMARLCGAEDKRHVIGRRAGAFFPQSLARRYEVLDRQVLASGRPIMNTIDLSLRARRIPTWLIFSRTPVMDRQGSVVGVAAAASIVGLRDRNRLAMERLARAVAMLKSDFRRPLDIMRLAGRARASPAQLQRDFANFLFLSPRAYQRKLRMERAIELIEEGRPISDVALECGYTDHSAFTRSFKKVMGMPPKEYRKLFGA